jgi:hypothetical protein
MQAPRGDRERTAARGSPCRPVPPRAVRSQSGARSPRNCGSRRQESHTRLPRPGAHVQNRGAGGQADASSGNHERNRPGRREPVSIRAEAGALRPPTRHPTVLRIPRPAILPARSSRPSAALLRAYRSRRTKALHPAGCSAACSRTRHRLRRDPKAAARPPREMPNWSVLPVVRQAHHERNHPVAVGPELAEGSWSKDIAQRFPSGRP